MFMGQMGQRGTHFFQKIFEKFEKSGQKWQKWDTFWDNGTLLKKICPIKNASTTRVLGLMGQMTTFFLYLVLKKIFFIYNIRKNLSHCPIAKNSRIMKVFGRKNEITTGLRQDYDRIRTKGGFNGSNLCYMQVFKRI